MEKRKFWYLIGIGVVIVFLFIFVADVISVGERLRNIHVYVEYGFYVLSAILLYVLIINPVRIIVFAPTFSVEMILEDDLKRHSVYKKAAKRLLENPVLTDEDKERLRNALHNRKKLREELTYVFKTTINDEIHEVIIKNSKNVLISTALSQNGNLDMISVVMLNLKMIKEITILTGFRPTTPKLAKLSLNVLSTAIVSEGLNEADISELLPNKISETLTDLPLIKTLSNSIMSGVANALLTCRVGLITEKYLFTDNELLDKKELRTHVLKEALKMMPVIVTGGLAKFPKGVANFFSKPFKKKSRSDEE
jgi:hypothetical protein